MTGKSISANTIKILGVLIALVVVQVFNPVALAQRNGGHLSRSRSQASRAWYFAEGTTREGFEEWICLLNPGDEPTEAHISYMLDGGGALSKEYGLPSGQRITIDVSRDVEPNRDVSLLITSGEPILAERSMYFSYKGNYTGSHSTSGAKAPQEEWHFAEGCTRNGFDTFLCLQNPQDENSIVDIEYCCGDGLLEERKGVIVPAHSRFTVPVHEGTLGIGRHDNIHGDFSIRVKSSNEVPFVAERSVYFSYGPFFNGGHVVTGVSSPAEEWHFAEGCTRDGFQTYLCLGNPNTEDALVDINYYCGDGSQQSRKDILLPGKSRYTVPVHEPELGIGRHDSARGDVSINIKTTNGVPILAERPVYFTYKPFWSDGHNAFGSLAPEECWFFAEGCSRHGYDTYICIGNTSDKDAIVDITYYCGDGAEELRKDILIPRFHRLTIPVHSPVHGIGRCDNLHGDFGAKIESTNGVPVVVERAMYFAPRWRTMDRDAIASAWRWGEITRGSSSTNKIALTFDIEYNRGNVFAILDILKQKNLNCTMFTLGSFASGNPDLMQRMANEGHEIANHSLSHPSFTSLSGEEVSSQLRRTDDIVRSITGFSTRPYFRFPYGGRNGQLISQVNAEGYLSVYWTIDPQDWRASSDSVKSIVCSQARNGAIILLHDKGSTVGAIPGIIEDLASRGFNLVTLTELLYPGPQ